MDFGVVLILVLTKPQQVQHVKRAELELVGVGEVATIEAAITWCKYRRSIAHKLLHCESEMCYDLLDSLARILVLIIFVFPNNGVIWLQFLNQSF